MMIDDDDSERGKPICALQKISVLSLWKLLPLYKHYKPDKLTQPGRIILYFIVTNLSSTNAWRVGDNGGVHISQLICYVQFSSRKAWFLCLRCTLQSMTSTQVGIFQQPSATKCNGTSPNRTLCYLMLRSLAWKADERWWWRRRWLTSSCAYHLALILTSRINFQPPKNWETDHLLDSYRLYVTFPSGGDRWRRLSIC